MTTMTAAAPFGSWKSPISSALLTSSGIGFSELRFSRDNLYWLESRPDEAGRVVVVRLPVHENTPSDVTPPGFNVRTRVHEYGGGAFFANDDTIFFSNFKDQRLYRQDPAATPLPVSPEPPSPASWRYADGRVTPDGKTIVCVRERHEEGREAINEIVSMPADGSEEPKVILSGYDFYSFPRISSDGAKLAWTCWRHPQMPWDGTELWTGDLGAGASVSNLRLVAGSSSESISEPQWGPGGALYFISDRTNWWNLYVERDGKISGVLEWNAEIGIPQWLFGSTRYAFLSAGRIACIVNENGFEHIVIVDPSGHPEKLPIPYSTFASIRSDDSHTLYLAGASPLKAAEIASLDLQTRTMRVIKRSLSIELDDGYISQPEPIEFPTANERTAYGLFYPPRNRDFRGPDGERPPLIVISHGGPTSATTPALRLPVQYWTSRGFAVVDVNYSGSTGYGRAYRERLKGNWGVADVDDCINAARYLERRDDVDGKRMVIRGGSAGGYTTLCALVFHNVFSAGASYYGVADLESLARDTHKFESRYLDSLIGPYPEALERYQQRSPVHFADRLSCPVILFQGLEDKAVPPSQAEVMVRTLRAKRLPFAYVVFASEGHGFRDAANIRRSIEAELYFYSRTFGFTAADRIEPVQIENL